MPPVGGPKKPSAVKFSDDFDDEFSEGSGDDVDSPNEANNEDDEDQDGDFNANELLNLGDYQKKRQGMGDGLGRDKESPLPSLAPIKTQPPAQRSVLGGVNTTQAGADEAFDFSDEEDDIESSVEEQKRAADIDFAKFDYATSDLNKLSDAELRAHKAAMEIKFKQNAVKKGDPGFKYDKRVDFKQIA